MKVPNFSPALPCFSRAKEEQTDCSLVLRVTACALGAITLLIGALVLRGIPGLHTLGTVPGGVMVAVGGLFLMLAVCLKVNKPTVQAKDTYDDYAADLYEPEIKQIDAELEDHQRKNAHKTQQILKEGEHRLKQLASDSEQNLQEQAQRQQLQRQEYQREIEKTAADIFVQQSADILTQ